jgi:type IV pilus assembly protein PilZ
MRREIGDLVALTSFPSTDYDQTESMSPENGNPPNGADRREHFRAPIELKVEYKKLNTFFADYTKNICKGGTFIKTKKPLDIGTEFLFKLSVPNLIEPLALRGQVKWVMREGEPPPEGVPADHEPGMGIRFIYETDDQREAVEKTVEKLMVDSLGPLLYTKLMGK